MVFEQLRDIIILFRLVSLFLFSPFCNVPESHLLFLLVGLGSNSHSRVKLARRNTFPWRIGDCYMGPVQDLVEILATLLVIIFIVMHNSVMVSLKQFLREIFGVYIHHVQCGRYPTT